MSRKLDDWIEGWLSYQNNTEPPEQFKLWVAISIIAAALQRKCTLQLGHLKVFTNMYIVLVGPSGCRKGTAMTPGKDILKKKGIKLSAESTTREALIRALKNATDATIDGDQGTFEAHASLTIYAQELTTFMGYNNVQLMNDLTDLFDCSDQWDYDTKDETKKDFIHYVWLNMIGATTPETLHSALPMESVGGGFTSRIIFVYASSKSGVIPIPYISAEEQETYNDLVSDLSAIMLLRGEFKYTADFVKVYSDWCYEHEKNPPFTDPRLGGYIDRKRVHALKLSMIISASQGDDMQITGAIFNRALKLLEKTEEKMSIVYSGFGESRDSSVLSRVMTDLLLNKEKGYTFEEIVNKYYYDADSDMIRRIWTTLTAMKQFEARKNDQTQETRLYYIEDEDGNTRSEDLQT